MARSDHTHAKPELTPPSHALTPAGKTTVATLYGEILRHLGLLSNGEVVVKNPSDFIGAVLGESEKKTNAILDATVGKVRLESHACACMLVRARMCLASLY